MNSCDANVSKTTYANHSHHCCLSLVPFGVFELLNNIDTSDMHGVSLDRDIFAKLKSYVEKRISKIYGNREKHQNDYNK